MTTEPVWVMGGIVLYLTLAYLIERQAHRETRWKLEQAQRNCQIAEHRARTAQKAVARGGYTYRELLEDV